MKVLKIAALVVGAVALIATGIGAAAGAGLIGAGGTFLGVSAATFATIGTIASVAAAVLSAASVLLTPQPKGTVGGNQTKFTIDKDSGLPYAMGRTLSGGKVVHRAYYGPKNVFESWVTVHSLGPVRSLGSLLIDKVAITFAGMAALGSYAGYMWLDEQLGACPEPAAMVGSAGGIPGWDASSKLSGLAADLWTLKFDTNGKKFPTGVPQRGRVVEGVHVYDPRQDSTYPGGSGPCRIGDESTYVWSDNPALHAITWAYGRHQNGALLAGGGLNVAGIDMPPFVDWANVCDANGWKVGGIVYTTADNKWDVLKMIAQAGCGEVMPVGALLSCTFSAPRVSIGTITSADIAGDLDVPSTASARVRRNTIIPRVRLESQGWEIVPLKAVSVADYITLDGAPRPKEIVYPLIQDADQGAVAAMYDMLNARELDGMVIPCKIYALGYRPGDCLTLDIPEANLIEREVIVRNRELGAGDLGVTLVCRTETPGKHELALGTSGVPPVTPDLSIPSTDVAAPDGADWTLAGATFTDNGASIPALVVTGAVGNPNASRVLFDFRPYDAGNGPDDNWSAASSDSPDVTRKEFSGVTPGTQYEVGVRYFVRGVAGARLILGPATAGDLSTAGQISTFIRSAYIKSETQLLTAADVSGDGQITIANHSWDYPNKDEDVARTGGTITGLDLGARYYVYFDDSTLTDPTPGYVATPYYADALNSTTHPFRHFLDYVDVPASGDPPAGGGGGGGGYCPADDMHVLVKDAGTMRVADLAVGTLVWARHEITGVWGWYPVAAISFADAECLEAEIQGATYRATPGHLWWLGQAWRKMASLPMAAPIGVRRIAIIEVEDAHTYLLLASAGSSRGILSHNKVVEPTL